MYLTKRTPLLLATSRSHIDGRIEPANTLALEILRKLYRHDSYYTFDANQFLLAVTTNPAECECTADKSK
ncbi:hypothetical protein [Chitinophaga pinensis]|uniref:hypothetical protein n=1 Tax=Chitinophaga pinensis TaxID=79329 RepID=UPI001C995608|nr:hypothetical protein [Chitinophaga pinensis]